MADNVLFLDVSLRVLPEEIDTELVEWERRPTVNAGGHHPIGCQQVSWGSWAFGYRLMAAPLVFLVFLVLRLLEFG